MLTRCCCLLLGSMLAVATGCAMCSSCDDYCYSSSGGRWERLDPCFGRVGSAFTPEVGVFESELGSEELGMEESIESLPSGEPTPADDPAPEPPRNEPPRRETSVLQNRGIISR